ncbi:protein PF14_0175, partial [Rhopalosiphum maidis]|uniref:protein PF14_0175 n=1 Tax=Rhopalosiphum maidis TaxID=43146 RepID=UPI000EFDC045
MMDPNNLPHHVYLHKDHKYKLKLGFHAAPSNPKAFSKAIRDELQNLKFTYCSDLNGLIMGFGKISSNELIPADIRHCISVVVNVDVYIFRPPVGSIIEAIVNQTSDNHVSCLVHNLFNVSIVRPENEPYDQWSGSKIKKDDKIDVKVLSFDLTKKLPHITGEIIKKKDECHSLINTQDSSPKSSFSKNVVSDFTKSFNKNTVSPSKSSLSDSESSTDINNISMPKIRADESTKTSPLSINTTIKHAEKVDLTVSPLISSKLSSSDSESSVEMNNMITSSKLCDNKSTNKSPVTTNTVIQHKDTADSSSEFSESDSEFSSKMKAMLSSIKEGHTNKSSRTSSSIRNSINNNNHIESPLFSSTPISNSEHSVNSINLIRNKQLEQLKKHLAKKSIEKKKSLASVKLPNPLAKNKHSQSLNILENSKNNYNNDNQLKIIADSVNNNENSDDANKINHNNSHQSNSSISDSELGQKNILVNNSFSNKPGKSKKTTKKHQKSNEIVNAILNSISTNKMKPNAYITKHLVNSNNECSKDNQEENTVYTQHEYNLDKEMLNDCKNSNEQAVKNSLKLSLSTKNIKKKDTPQKKDTDDCKNQIKSEKFKESLKPTLSMISDSDSNCSRDHKLSIKDFSHTIDVNEKIENETSSSDDEIYSKLKQNISKTQINTSHLNEKPKSQSLLYNQINYSTDESDSSAKLFCNTSKLSSKSIKSNKTTHNSINISETDSCNKSYNNLLSNEKTFKKCKKKKKVNETSVLPQLSNEIVNKMDIIKHILEKDSSSDNEVTDLKNKTSDEKQQVNEKNSRKKPIKNVSKPNKNNGELNTDISNPFLKVYTTNVTSSSSDDETFDVNLKKSKVKSSGKKNVIPLVNEEKKKNILINQVLTSLKRNNKKQKLSVSQTNLNASEINDTITKDKPLLNTKNKKDVLKNIKISIGKQKPYVSNLNVHQKHNLSQLNTQPSDDDNTNDEKDVIKKILKKRKLKKTKKADILEQTMKINIPTELNKQKEIKKNLHIRSKSPKNSITNEEKCDKIKNKKKKRKNKDFLLNSIISALDDSLSDHPPSKKKKKVHALAVESYDSKDKNSDGNLSEVKIKKKKKSKHKEDVNLSDLTVKDKKKKKCDSLLESVSKNIQENEDDNTSVKVTKKKKVKSNPVCYETQSITTNKQSKINDKLEDKKVKNTGSSKKKTKKLLESQIKNFILTQDNTHLDNLYNLLSS